jgi:hypothetical protein
MPLAAGTLSAMTRVCPFGVRALTRALITSVTYITPRESKAMSSGATIGPPTGEIVSHAPVLVLIALT